MKPIDPHALITIQQNPGPFLNVMGEEMPSPAEILKFILKAINDRTIDQVLYGWDYPSQAEFVCHHIKSEQPKTYTKEYFDQKYSDYRRHEREYYLDQAYFGHP